MKQRSPEDAAAELGELRERLNVSEAETKGLWARRLEVLLELKNAGWSDTAIAEADGSNRHAVIATLKRAQKGA